MAEEQSSLWKGGINYPITDVKIEVRNGYRDATKKNQGKEINKREIIQVLCCGIGFRLRGDKQSTSTVR